MDGVGGASSAGSASGSGGYSGSPGGSAASAGVDKSASVGNSAPGTQSGATQDASKADVTTSTQSPNDSKGVQSTEDATPAQPTESSDISAEACAATAEVEDEAADFAQGLLGNMFGDDQETAHPADADKHAAPQADESARQAPTGLDLSPEDKQLGPTVENAAHHASRFGSAASAMLDTKSLVSNFHQNDAFANLSQSTSVLADATDIAGTFAKDVAEFGGPLGLASGMFQGVSDVANSKSTVETVGGISKTSAGALGFAMGTRAALAGTASRAVPVAGAVVNATEGVVQMATADNWMDRTSGALKTGSGLALAAGAFTSVTGVGALTGGVVSGALYTAALGIDHRNDIADLVSNVEMSTPTYSARDYEAASMASIKDSALNGQWGRQVDSYGMPAVDIPNWSF